MYKVASIFQLVRLQVNFSFFFLLVYRYGITVVMTTSLSSDVPVGYFSWFEYPIMDPPEPKTKSALAAAFISNCGAHNERLRFLELLQQEGIKVDSYGACNQNVVGGRGTCTFS